MILKNNKLIFVSIILLTLISFGTVSASEDSDNLSANEDEFLIDSSYETSISDDGAFSSEINNENSKLGSVDDNVLSGSVAPTYSIEVQPNVTSGSTYVAQYGQKIIVNGNFGDATGNVSISFGYSGHFDNYSCQLVNGAFSQEITKYVVRNNQQIKIVYNGDDTYKSTTITKNIHVQANNFTATGADYGQIAFVYVNLFNATGNVNFTINNKTYSSKLENGEITQEFTNYTMGKNEVKIVYEGDENFDSYEKTLSFNIKLNNDTPTIYNYQTASVKLYLGEATGTVNFTYNNSTTPIDITNGVALFEFNDYSIGVNDLIASYSGDNTYNPFTVNLNLTVLAKEDSTILSSVYQEDNKNFVAICIPFGNGTVNASINGKKLVLDLIDGVAIYEIASTDVIKNIKVTYDGNNRLNPAKSSKFIKLNKIVNNETWKYYFNQLDGGKFFSYIPEGITLDFQGAIINPDTNNVMGFDINKPVNIISTTKDAYIDLNTTSGSYLGENPGNCFIVSRGGSGSNITGISFHNTQLWISNTSDVVFDSISQVIEDQRVGSGVGATSVRDNSSYVTIKNSYFYTRNNGGSTTFTFSWANYCTFDNNTVKAEGNVGNLLYLNVYNIVGVPTGVPVNTYNKFTNNKVYGKEGSAISVGIMVEGEGNIIENNTMYKSSISTSFGGVGAKNNSYIGNILEEGSSLTAQANSIVYNNIVPGSLSTGANSTAFNNTVLKAMTVGAGALAYNNTVGGLTLSGIGAVVHDNIVNGASTISNKNVYVFNNNFSGENTIKFSSANANNVTFENNYVLGNIEFTANAKNNYIINNTIITSKDYAIDLKAYTTTNNVIVDNYLSSGENCGNDAVNFTDDGNITVDNFQISSADINVYAENIKADQTAKINVTTNETLINSVVVTINNKQYALNLSEGVGSLEVPNLEMGSYNVSVVSGNKLFNAQNSTQFNVTKYDSPEMNVAVGEITQGIASNITVTINDATGNVTLNIAGNSITENLVNGICILAVPDLDAGNYSYEISYSGDYKYLSNTTMGNLTVNENKQVKISISDTVFERYASKFYATFTNYLDIPIKDADVTITVNQFTYDLVTDENGQVEIDLGLTKGKYPINIVFEGSENYSKVTKDAVIIVCEKTVISIVSKSKGVVSGKLVDVDGNVISNAKIVYSLAGGSKLNTVTNNNGVFTIKPAKDGVLLINFAGDEINKASNMSITLKNFVHVVKTTTIKSSAKTFKAKAKTKYFSVTLKSGNSKLSGKKVKVQIKGKTFTAKTNKKGIAKVNIKLTKKGKYTAKISFAGDSNYKSSTAKVRVTIK